MQYSEELIRSVVTQVLAEVGQVPLAPSSNGLANTTVNEHGDSHNHQQLADRFPNSVLQSGLWMTYVGAGEPSRFHAAPAAEDETVLVLSDYILPALLTGRLSVQEAADRGLVAASGPDGPAAL